MTLSIENIFIAIFFIWFKNVYTMLTRVHRRQEEEV